MTIINNVRSICALALVSAALASGLPASPASAQNIFESLFGAPRGPSNAYADPNAHVNSFGRPVDPEV